MIFCHISSPENRCSCHLFGKGANASHHLLSGSDDGDRLLLGYSALESAIPGEGPIWRDQRHVGEPRGFGGRETGTEPCLGQLLTYLRSQRGSQEQSCLSRPQLPDTREPVLDPCYRKWAPCAPGHAHGSWTVVIRPPSLLPQHDKGERYPPNTS